MSYTIIYENKGREVGRETMDVRLAEAQAYAETTVQSGIYERVEIRDDQDKLVGHYPRTLRAAP